METARTSPRCLGRCCAIDVDHTSTGRQYAIPADNPFAGGGGLPEIWAYGFRNPWRFSFDFSTSRLIVGDVGQDHFEEVDIVDSGGNFGWNTMEGLHCYNPSTGCNMAGLVLPIIEYDHSEGAAVIGGYVYRGSAIPDLVGSYVMADFESGKLVDGERVGRHMDPHIVALDGKEHQFTWPGRIRRDPRRGLQRKRAQSCAAVNCAYL